MAAIDHSGDKVPCTRVVALDGGVQQIIPPPNTRYIAIKFITTAGSYKLQSKDAAVDSDLVAVPADTWLGFPLMADYMTGAPASSACPLFVDGDALAQIAIEYSFVGGRGG